MKIKWLATVGLLQAVNAYDDSIKECWDVRLRNEDYFCYDAVGWPLSINTYYDSDERDASKSNSVLLTGEFRGSRGLRSSKRKMAASKVPRAAK